MNALLAAAGLLAGPFDGTLNNARAPRWPDPHVFGPELPRDAHGRIPAATMYGHVWCPCGAGWDGLSGSRCWACGGAGWPPVE